MATDCTYSYFRVSKSEAVHDSARKYQNLRLRALQASPGSFASTYEIESAFSEADWVERLTAPGREVFICAATPQRNNADQSNTVEWIGQLTLRGPASLQDFTLPAESGQPTQMPDEERWQMLSLFTLPEHRGHGLGANLCREALDYLQNYQKLPQTVQVRLMVKPENKITVNLYQRLGFVKAGRCTLAEALIANGDEHILPSDLSSTKWSARSGLIMIFKMIRG